MTGSIKEQIAARLDDIESTTGARILFAVESGSRAWGFPSPDSDYDVRFVYAMPPRWYFSIKDRRDVIELPIDGVFDINGWDIRKALRLLVKPNPALLEWLYSPIVYRADRMVFENLRELVRRTMIERSATYHYLHLGEGQWRRFLHGRDVVPLKKYFYALRPALALRWLRIVGNQPVPVDLTTLMQELSLARDVVGFLDSLMNLKATSKEVGTGPRNAALDRLILDEFSMARERRSQIEQRTSGDAAALEEQAEVLFKDIVLGPNQHLLQAEDNRRRTARDTGS